MRFKDVRFHTLFTDDKRIYRKGSNAFSVDILTGNANHVFALHDRVEPVSREQAHTTYPTLDQRLL